MTQSVTAAQGGIRTEAGAVCAAGVPGGCNWYSIGATETEILDAAGQHAAENPGHRVTCQVRQTRTWAVQADAIVSVPQDADPDTTEGN